MSGKNLQLSPLAVRKQLLIAESNLNRAQLAQDWQMMAGEVRALADQAGILRSIVSAAAGLLRALTAWRHRKSASASTQPSWWRSVLKGVTLVATLWPSGATRPAANPRRGNTQ